MNTTIKSNLPALSNEGGLTAYLEQIKNFLCLMLRKSICLQKIGRQREI